MNILSFFYTIAITLLIIFALLVYGVGNAEAQSVIHPILDVQREQIEKYGEVHWQSQQDYRNKIDWYQHWARYLEYAKEYRELEITNQNNLMERGREAVEFYKPIKMAVWIEKYNPELGENQWLIATLNLLPYRDDLPCGVYDSGKKASGCYRYSDESIWIMKGLEGRPSKLGCSLLWHEILHGKGLDHGAMKQKYDHWVCAIGQR